LELAVQFQQLDLLAVEQLAVEQVIQSLAAEELDFMAVVVAVVVQEAQQILQQYPEQAEQVQQIAAQVVAAVDQFARTQEQEQHFKLLESVATAALAS
jgi:hypothetical protein